MHITQAMIFQLILVDEENADNSDYTLLIYPPGDKYLTDLENHKGIDLEHPAKCRTRQQIPLLCVS
jgi:hypothetical protein